MNHSEQNRETSNTKNRDELLVRAQCFGNFEIFIQEIPIKFRYQKCKELLAYLIDRRGAMITMQELVSVLWENEKTNTDQVRKLIFEIRKTLADFGLENLIIRHRNEIAVAPHQIDCDFYRYLNGDKTVIFLGEYMTNYSWAEMTTGYLEDDFRRKMNKEKTKAQHSKPNALSGS